MALWQCFKVKNKPITSISSWSPEKRPQRETSMYGRDGVGKAVKKRNSNTKVGLLICQLLFLTPKDEQPKKDTLV